MFIFAAPLLYFLHSVIAGLFMALLKVFGVIALWNGNLLSSILTNLANADKTQRMWLMWVLGLIQIVVYFVLFTFLIKKFNYHTPGRESEPVPASAAPQPQAEPAKAAVKPQNSDGIASVIQGLGGKGNINTLENCITRLRVNVKDISLIDEALINQVPNSGIVKKGNDLQIIYGLQVADVKREVEQVLQTM